MNNSLLDVLLQNTLKPPKPKIFVSYHHQNDQAYADRFTRLFDDTYDSVTDRSLVNAVNSEDCDYVYRCIRDQYITGTSCTVVLCGVDTCNRKYVDWEIKATLDKQHGLLGVLLPTYQPYSSGMNKIPDRLNDNILTAYAHCIWWTEDPQVMISAISNAKERSKRTRQIVNSRTMMRRNR